MVINDMDDNLMMKQKMDNVQSFSRTITTQILEIQMMNYKDDNLMMKRQTKYIQSCSKTITMQII